MYGYTDSTRNAFVTSLFRTRIASKLESRPLIPGRCNSTEA